MVGLVLGSWFCLTLKAVKKDCRRTSKVTMEQGRQGVTEKGKGLMEKGSSSFQGESLGLMEQGGSSLQGERQGLMEQGAGGLQGAKQDGSGLHILEIYLQDPNQPSTENAPQVAPETAAELVNVSPLPPVVPQPKKRKPNANGPSKKSSCWDHFIELTDVPERTAACKHCHKKYKCDPKIHGTSSLLAHSRVCNKNPYLANDLKQTNLVFASGEGGGLVSIHPKFDKEACRRAITLFVILDEHPFKVVEGEGFKNLCKQLEPLLNTPSRRTIARDCFQLYLDEKLRLKAFFRSDCSRVALTTDCWTSLQNFSYMTITAHFIDNEWNYQKRIISFSSVPNHKGDTVGRKIEDVLREWGIRNVSTITVDNASSNDVAVAYLKKRLKIKNGLMGDADFFHMRCNAHILNLVVTDGLKDQDTSISSIRNAVRFVRSSPQRALKFKECVEFSRIPCKKLLCLDVPTRWNTSYMMMDAAEKFQPAFEKLEGEDSGYLEWFGAAGPPSCSDWEKVRAFVKFLKIFYDATKVFSSSQQVSLHTAFDQLTFVLSELNAAALNLNSVFASMGVEMKRKYDKYWGSVNKTNQFLYFGVIFDPHFKFRYIEWSFDQIYGAGSDISKEMAKNVKDSLFKLYNWFKAAHDQSNVTSTLAGASNNQSEPRNPSPSDMAKRADTFKQHLKDQDTIDKQNELERYLNDPCANDNDKLPILAWWKQNKPRYPILAAMVKEILATPVSTVASESAFSTGGRILECYRSSLSPAMAEGLICTQNWLRPSFTSFKNLDLDEEYEVSEDVIAEFQQMSLSGSVGAGTSGAAAACGAAVGSTQSQPLGCD